MRIRYVPYVLSLLFIAGCEHTSTPPASVAQGRDLLNPAPIPAPTQGDEGVVVARTDSVGATTALAPVLRLSDCENVHGLGIKVESALAERRYIFGPDGQPCPQSKELFNGRRAIDQRAAPLGVEIGFKDSVGPVVHPDENPGSRDNMTLPVLDLMSEASRAMPDMGLRPEEVVVDGAEQSADDMPSELREVADEMREGAAQEFDDNLNRTIKHWNLAEHRNRLMKESEKILAKAREDKRNTSFDALREKQDKIAEMAAQMREMERKLQLQEQRKEDLMMKLEKTRATVDASRVAEDRENRKAREQIEQVSARAKDLERYSQRLKQEQKAKERAYQKRIAEISADLKAAKARAKAARHAAVLQAAKQIAEAERLTLAAKVAQRQSMEQEAERLQTEADALARQARSLPGEVSTENSPELERAYSSLISGAIEDADTMRVARLITNGKPSSGNELERVNLTIHEKDTPLKDIFKRIFSDLEPRLGPWNVSWELTGKNQHIAAEPWTVAAEATLNDFLSYVVDKVHQTHGVSLSFQVFDENRLLVITDE